MDALFGKTLSQLQDLAVSQGLKPFVGKQIANWLYQQKITSIDEMTNLSLEARQGLKEKYQLGLMAHQKVDVSVDGTKKYLYHIKGHQYVEAAYIPDGDRATLCVSSQVGCKMGCLFCMTGKQGFQYHLSAGEILNQFHSLPEVKNITNIVYMGMGEPLDNLDSVLDSLEILTSSWGYGMSSKRITLSTIGIIPGMKKFLDTTGVHLAISIHSPYEEERKSLMPIQQVYPIADIIELLKGYDWSGQRRLSFEYICFDGVNDSEDHARALARLLGGIKARVNLIHFHPIPDSPLTGSSRSRMETFQTILKGKGYYTTIRKSRGEDIFAACGLLSTKEKLAQESKDY
ncbi:23S rRNA (adenine(2503)-C(2))-methyltransferase RlmN [Oceanispirochaeta crateris]|uniref:Probable dual-specificity RNA methyltransferase RlmN n=1 Tax=Oceanispirochaeta crateris TaxID=2518645 RepID=A0A5C1QIY9_9SPIO|nr:23S rRNA (adenine(2503)-C(2))-methyltransferase RlmN [Oceanispirochaeta crateris]QEN08125.1 23S rRNA (adenine(2503)-C(2))-methyltransferase RlmN [Oceanispirochaeta crateris]